MVCAEFAHTTRHLNFMSLKILKKNVVCAVISHTINVILQVRSRTVALT